MPRILDHPNVLIPIWLDNGTAGVCSYLKSMHASEYSEAHVRRHMKQMLASMGYTWHSHQQKEAVRARLREWLLQPGDLN